MVDVRIESFEFQGEPMAALGKWAYAPVVPTQAMALTGGDDLEIVGESKYQLGIRRLLNKLHDDGEVELMALLVSEPLNPFDRHAVRVDLLVDRDREVAGYLSREQAFIFHDLIKSAMDIGALPLMKARAFGGTHDKPFIGIWLIHFPDDAATESVTDEMTERTNERRIARDQRNGR